MLFIMEKEKEIVREIAQGDKHYQRESAARKAQICKVFVRLNLLMCALRSANSLR